MSSSHSAFEFLASVHPLARVLDEVRSMGYELQRTKDLTNFAATVEVGYLIVGTDVTISDPEKNAMYFGRETISVYCPNKIEHDLGSAKHDPKLNRKVYNRLKKKFAMTTTEIVATYAKKK